MERNLAHEIDELRSELERLRELVEPSSRIDKIAAETGSDGTTGFVSYEGSFASSGRQSTWGHDKVCTDTLVELVDDGLAGRVLACVGSPERMKLLTAILRKPSSVASLVESCGFSSTGQVYHHLKPLLAANIVTEDKSSRGVYVIQPHRVQGIIMLLVGVRDLVDTTYTSGDWQ